MARKGRSIEEIIFVLSEAEVRIGQGETVGKIRCWLIAARFQLNSWHRNQGQVTNNFAENYNQTRLKYLA